MFDMAALENGVPRFVDDMPGGASRYTRAAKGFEAVFVNGELVLENDEYVKNALPRGQVV
jgi:hypothetical protein